MQFAIEHLGLPSLNPKALQQWYVNTLGAQLLFDNGQTPPAYFVALPGGVMIEIYEAGAALGRTADNGLAGWRHVALRVDSIETAKALLEARGVIFSQPIKPAGGGGRVLFFADADGNLLHLVERPAGSVFGSHSEPA